MSGQSPLMRSVLLVRHGQSTWNAEQRWQGQADPPLSALGEEQARGAASRLAVRTVDVVVSSDLQRAHCTAMLLVPAGAVVLEPAWRERRAGDWTGLARSEIEARYPGWIDQRRWPPGFEGDAALLARALPALERLVAQLPEPGSAVVVTHGGVVRTLEHHLGAPAAVLPNLAARELLVRDGDLMLGERHLLLDPQGVEVTLSPQL
jgi:broad specificity phosphatase PhoE